MKFRGENKLPRKLMLALFIALTCVCACMFISGCKYTDVLTEHVESPDAVEDKRAKPVYENAPDSPEENLISYAISNSDRVDEQQQTLAGSFAPEENNGETKEREHSEANSDERATQGDEKSDKGEGASTASEEKEDNSGNKPSEMQSDEAKQEGEIPQEGGGGGAIEVVDEDGTAEEPSHGVVATAGEYATIAQMLGGKGALVAADQDWLNRVKEAGVFPGETDEIEVGWSGDGSKAGSCDVEKLIELRPGVVLTDGKNVKLSADERTQLENAGIKVQAVPLLDEATVSDANILLAVQAVSQVLAGSSDLQYDVNAQAKKYTELHDKALTACYDANKGYSYKQVDGRPSEYLYQDEPSAAFKKSNASSYSTAYIDAWTSSSTGRALATRHVGNGAGEIQLGDLDGKTLNASTGVGLSVPLAGDETYVTLDYYLQLAGVVDATFYQAKPSSRNAIIPGWADKLISGIEPGINGSFSSMWYAVGASSAGASSWRTVGDERYPAVIVRDHEMAKALKKSGESSNGLYNVGQSYQVWIMPQGFSGSWAYGNVESFLVAPWALGMFTGNRSGDQYAADFYSIFYRCNADTGVNYLDIITGTYYDPDGSTEEQGFYLVKSTK